MRGQPEQQPLEPPFVGHHQIDLEPASAPAAHGVDRVVLDDPPGMSISGNIDAHLV